MLTVNGIGPSGAAWLLIAAGDNTRLPTKGHFASWNGPALLHVSAGTGLGWGVVRPRDSHGTCDGFGRGACVGCVGRKPLAGRCARRARSGDTTSVKGVRCRPDSDPFARATTRVTGTRTVQAR